MKKQIALLTILGMLTFGFVNNLSAQPDSANTEMVDTSATTDAAPEMKTEAKEAPAKKAENNDVEIAKEASFTQTIKTKFIEGGVGFMGIVLICLIIGLALCIERIVYLNLATTNTKKLLGDVESALQTGGVEAAKEVCRNTRGPVASIFYQGLLRADSGIDAVEKAVVSYGGVQMGLLEKGVSWISLFIALAPMLGFMGTVIGMIGAFDAIAAANNIQPSIVAVGIKVALLTTVFGLIVAMILQVFYNYIVSKIDSLVNTMEDASISLVDIVENHKK